MYSGRLHTKFNIFYKIFGCGRRFKCKHVKIWFRLKKRLIHKDYLLLKSADQLCVELATKMQNCFSDNIFCVMPATSVGIWLEIVWMEILYKYFCTKTFVIFWPQKFLYKFFCQILNFFIKGSNFVFRRCKRWQYYSSWNF